MTRWSAVCVFLSSPLLRIGAQIVSLFVGFVNPRGPFWMCHISVNCHRHMKQQPSPCCYGAWQPPLPSGNDTKCTPVFLSARLLWGCILNRLWQGDLCYRLWWSLPFLLDKKDIFVSKQSGRKKVSLHYLILWSSLYYTENERWSFTGDSTKVRRRFQS